MSTILVLQRCFPVYSDRKHTSLRFRQRSLEEITNDSNHV